jgi:hypothetical protein
LHIAFSAKPNRSQSEVCTSLRKLHGFPITALLRNAEPAAGRAEVHHPHMSRTNPAQHDPLSRPPGEIIQAGGVNIHRGGATQACFMASGCKMTFPGEELKEEPATLP